MADCIFCSIITGESEAETLFEDDMVLVIRDKFPKAPFHILVLPKRHVDSLNEMADEDALLLGRMTLRARAVAKEHGYDHYKLVWNTGEDAGMVIHHAHLHVLAGKKLGEV